MPALTDHGFSEALQGGLVGHIADEPIPRQKVDDMHSGALAAESVGNCSSYTLGPAGDDGDFVFKGVCLYHLKSPLPSIRQSRGGRTISGSLLSVNAPTL